MYLLQIKGLFNKHVFYFKKERKKFYPKKEGKMQMFYSVFINKKEQNLIGSLDLSNKVFAPLNYFPKNPIIRLIRLSRIENESTKSDFFLHLMENGKAYFNAPLR